MIYLVNKRTKEHRREPCSFPANGSADEWDIVRATPDGWIEWHGGECPLPDGAAVDLRYKSGAKGINARPAEIVTWERIIAYRPVLDADTKTEPPAWDGEGLPPVGARCEMLIAGWEEVLIAGMDSGGRAIAEVVSTGILIPTKDADRFRPIRSEEYRAKEAIAGEVLSAMDNGLGSCFKDVQIAAVIYAAIRDGKVPGVKLEDSND